jgi:hypothetical protein
LIGAMQRLLLVCLISAAVAVGSVGGRKGSEQQEIDDGAAPVVATSSGPVQGFLQQVRPFVCRLIRVRDG